MLVIFLFLRTVSATIIPALAVPISLIATCAVMYAFSFSINNMTLLALTLSVGFVVDDAIVMLENIVRHIEGGMRPFEAALKGAREIGFTIVSITFSLIAVFIPVLLMGGMVGRVFREFAVTIAVAIIMSGFVSLTLTPMLCARVLRTHHEGEKQNVVLRIFEAMFNSWLRGYEWTLDKVLKYKFDHADGHAPAPWSARSISTSSSRRASSRSRTPASSRRRSKGRPTSRSAPCGRARREIADIIRKDKAVDYVNSTIGVGGPNSTNNTGRIFVCAQAEERARRELRRRWSQRLRAAANSVVGMTTYFREIQNINLGGRISKGEFQYTMQSSETETALSHRRGDAREDRRRSPACATSTRDLYIKNPQIDDRDRPREGRGLRHLGRSDPPGTVRRLRHAPGRDDLHADQRLPDHPGDASRSSRPTPSGLSKIYLKTNLGNATSAAMRGRRRHHRQRQRRAARPIPLSAVTKLVPTVGPLQVNHQGQQPSVTISFNLAPGHLARRRRSTRSSKIERDSNLPRSIVTGFQGNAQVFQESLKGQGMLVLAAVFAAYVVLGILYESFIHPITIISGLPSAGVGALLVLMAFRMDLSVIAMIGIVMLVGIVKKNAIMMIDFALERRRVGIGAEAAIREACLLRFRPIMMTTFAAIFGALPIALGTGAGAELRQPLGVAVVGGLCVSQLLTLYITPVIYLYLDRIDRMLKRRLEPQLEEVPAAARRRRSRRSRAAALDTACILLTFLDHQRQEDL